MKITIPAQLTFLIFHYLQEWHCYVFLSKWRQFRGLSDMVAFAQRVNEIRAKYTTPNMHLQTEEVITG